MNYELFIARRMVKGGRSTFSKPVVRISIVSVALGLAVMIVSVAIVTGFQQQIRDKITGFGAHIQIARFDSNNSFETAPVTRNDSLLQTLHVIRGVKHIQAFATKAGIVQTDDQIQGIVLKGIGSDFDWSFFRDKLIAGSHFQPDAKEPNDSVIISRKLASMLHLKAGDPLRIYFIIDNQVRARRLVIAGIYSTGLEEFDRLYIFGDIGQIQGLNGWESDEVSGYEIMINRFRDLTEVSDQVYRSIGYDLDAMSIRDLYPQLFDWLDLQDMNVVIILVLMILVSGIAMISTLLVLILERTAMIGVLKALGSRNSVIRKVFIYNAIYILTRGLLWGNLVGISLCLVQKYTGWVQLPEESYFMSVVPIHLAVTDIVLLNMGTLFLCTLMMIIPSLVIARISPVKAIRLE